MKLRTEIQSAPQRAIIHHGRPVMLLGSCFSDNIGARLAADLFEVTVNPTGTLFNPLSIADALERIASGRPFEPDELFEHRGLWHSPMHHSRFSRRTQADTLEAINSELLAAHSRLPQCETLFVTLGSTRTFTDRLSGRVVANCHKLPADRFDEADMTLDEATAALRRILDATPAPNVVLTVSPVRHTAYGLEANALAKATLRLACAATCAADPRALYFPAYEIMTDDLRDYRFYDADLKHPAPIAVDYIYENLCTRLMDQPTRHLAGLCGKLSLRLRHRIDPTNPESESFTLQTRRMAAGLLQQYPQLERAIQIAKSAL